MSWLLPSLVVGLCFAGLVNSWPMESKSCLNRCYASLNLQLTPSKMDIFGLVLTVRLKESLGNVPGGGTAIYGLYRYVPL